MGRAVTLELSGLGLQSSETAYLGVLHGKTAALFGAASAIGALTGGANAAQRTAMQSKGEAFGSAFQLADDLLDLHGSEDETGKPLGVDWFQRRATLPLIHALRSATPADAKMITHLWQQDPFTVESLADLRGLVEENGGFKYGWQKVNEYRGQAGTYLEDIPPGDGRLALVHLIRDTFPLPVLPARELV